MPLKISAIKLLQFMPMIIVALGIFSTGNAAAQNTGDLSEDAVARNHIMSLRDGALLVRLQTRSQSLDKLRERGMADRAEELKQRQREENAEYVEAFATEFDFAPVYFFRSEDSKAIKEGRLDDVVFLNGQLIPDSSIKVEPRKIYTAEFGKVDPDNTKIRDSYRLDKDSTGLKQESTYYGAPNMGFEALVIMDDQFVQLRRPFPYYVRTFGKKGIINRSPRKTVRKMNQKLHQFY